MRSILHDIPAHLISLVEALRAKLRDPKLACIIGGGDTRPSISYHALKLEVLDLLYRDVPARQVIHQWMKLFAGSPVAVRPNRKVPRRRRTSFHRSFHFQRRVKKAVL